MAASHAERMALGGKVPGLGYWMAFGTSGEFVGAGLTYVRTYFPVYDDPLPGAEQGEVEYEITLEDWRNRGE